jgi:hypothetical protein
VPNQIEIGSVLLARAIQVVKSTGGTIGYFPDLVEQIRSRYGFLAVPKESEITEQTKGAEFRHGRVVRGDQTIVIDKFSVFNDGIVAETTSSTDDCDTFLIDLIEWAKAALPKAVPSGPRYYLSQIEFKMASPLEVYMPTMRPLGQKIVECLASYGIDAPGYEVTNIGLYFELIGKLNPQPGAFYIDRRLNVPYAEGRWFSQAPLRTEDHKNLLKQLEDI